MLGLPQCFDSTAPTTIVLTMASQTSIPAETPDMKNRQTTPPPRLDPNPDEPFYYAMRPNSMTYTDGNQKERTICIKGRNEEATKLFVEEDWDALAKFPEWSR